VGDELKDVISNERMEKYFLLSSEARSKATPSVKNDDEEAKLADMLQMFDSYVSDARHFAASGDLVSAFGAINYAHAWIDAAVRIGFMNGHGDDHLFTLPADEGVGE